MVVVCLGWCAVDKPVAASVAAIARRAKRTWEWLRWNVCLQIAYALWRVGEAFTAVGNWFEDLATAKHPLSLKTHWAQRDAPNGWQR